MQVRDRLVEMVRRRRNVSFVEIERFLSSVGFDWSGELEAVNESVNVVIWAGLNQSAIDLIWGLVDEGLLRFSAAHYLTYMADGRMLNLPVLGKLPGKRLKDAHWLPVVLNPGPKCGSAE